MGYAAIAQVGLSAIQGASAIKAAGSQGKEILAEGKIALDNKQKQISYKAGAQTVNFLQSGLTLEGTPRNVINETYNTGKADITALGKNYLNKARNLVTDARNKAISSLMSSASSSFSSLGSSFGSIGGSTGGLNTINSSGNGTSGWGTAVNSFNGGIDPGGTDILSSDSSNDFWGGIY